MNKVILIGNLTRNPDLSATKDDKTVCNFDIAVSDGYGDKETTEFFRVSVWNKMAENCGKFLQKGSKVGIIGKIKTYSYTKKDGTQATVPQIIASEVEFLSRKVENEAVTEYEPEQPKQPRQLEMTEINEEELPF